MFKFLLQYDPKTKGVGIQSNFPDKAQLIGLLELAKADLIRQSIEKPDNVPQIVIPRIGGIPS